MTVSAGQIMHLTGLIMRSSLSQGAQADLLAGLDDLRPYEVSELITHLHMNRLDLTQLSSYTNTDINERLDYIESNEKM